MDAEAIIDEFRKKAVPLPTTEYAEGFNKGIEAAIEIIEKERSDKGAFCTQYSVR